MRHIRVISRRPLVGATESTAEVVITFLVAILTAVAPLITASAPLKAQQDKYSTTDDVVPDWP